MRALVKVTAGPGFVLRDVPRPEIRDDEVLIHVRRALEHTGLLDSAAVRGSELDLFRRRMVEVAKALVGAPRLILFDEPGAGLD